MIRYFPKSQKSNTNSYDIIVDKYVGLLYWLDVIKYPKVTLKSWNVAYYSDSLTEAEELHKIEKSNHYILDVYLPRDLYLKLISKLDITVEKSKSKRELFEDVLNSHRNVIFDTSARKALYSLFTFDSTELSSVINEIKEMYPEATHINKKHVQATKLVKKQVYAKDIILALLLKNNPKLESRGQYLSRYKWKNWDKDLEVLCATLGRRTAYYAIKNAALKMLRSKVDYLENKIDITNHEELTYIDIYTLLYLYQTLECAKPAQLYSVLYKTELRLGGTEC